MLPDVIAALEVKSFLERVHEACKWREKLPVTAQAVDRAARAGRSGRFIARHDRRALQFLLLPRRQQLGIEKLDVVDLPTVVRRQDMQRKGGSGTSTLPSPFCAAWIAASAPSVMKGILHKSEARVKAARGWRAPVF